MALPLDDDVVDDVENVRVLDGVRDDGVAVAPLRGSVPPLMDGEDEKVPRDELRRRGDGLRRLKSIFSYFILFLKRCVATSCLRMHLPHCNGFLMSLPCL